VQAKIIEVDAERRRLSLSLKRVEGDGPTPASELGLSDEVFAEAPAEVALEESTGAEPSPEPVGAPEEPQPVEGEPEAEPEQPESQTPAETVALDESAPQTDEQQ
jgi:small subunit ribosomal protein S1